MLKFTFIEGEYTIHRFNSTDPVPHDVLSCGHFWIGKTYDELSVVCETNINLSSSKSDSGWCALKLIGPFDLNSTGILAGVASLLAKAGISIFALSTYDTDYILIREINRQKAEDILVNTGYERV